MLLSLYILITSFGIFSIFFFSADFFEWLSAHTHAHTRLSLSHTHTHTHSHTLSLLHIHISTHTYIHTQTTHKHTYTHTHTHTHPHKQTKMASDRFASPAHAITQTWEEPKQRGNQYFQAHMYDKAARCYTRAIVTYPHKLSVDVPYPVVDHYLSILYGNRAMAFLKLNKYELAVEVCMYVCMYVCMCVYVCLYVYMRVCMYVCGRERESEIE